MTLPLLASMTGGHQTLSAPADMGMSSDLDVTYQHGTSEELLSAPSALDLRSLLDRR